MGGIPADRPGQWLVSGDVAGSDPGVDLGEIDPGSTTDAVVIPKFNRFGQKHEAESTLETRLEETMGYRLIRQTAALPSVGWGHGFLFRVLETLPERS